MTLAGLRIAKAAEQYIGARFRLHGRDPANGLDCVGLVWESLKNAGFEPPAITGYSLRNLHIERWVNLAQTYGFQTVKDGFLAGDLLLLRVSNAQVHCGIIAQSGALIHAHAGLGRVVCTPMPLQWPVEHHWRLSEG